MDNKLSQLESNIEQLKENIQSIEECAKEVIACTEDNRFISEELSQKMIVSFDIHSKLRTESEQIIRELCGEAVTITSISDAENTMKEIDKKSAVSLAEQFYNLHSDKVAVEELLDEEKEKLRDILSKPDSVDNFDAVVGSYIDFVNAVSKMQELSVDEKLGYVGKFTPQFGALAAYTFASGDVSIREESDEVTADESSVETQSVPEAEADATSDESAEETQSVPEAEADVTSDESAEETHDSVMNEASDTKAETVSENSTTESDPAASIIEKLNSGNILIESGYDWGMISSKESESLGKKVGFKEFKKDLKSMGDAIPFCKMFLKIAASNGISNNNFLGIDKPDEVSRLDYAVGLLCKKGYINKYILHGRGEFYCPTSKLEETLKASVEARKLIEIKEHEISISGTKQHDVTKGAFVTCNQMYMELYEKGKQHDAYFGGSSHGQSAFVRDFKLSLLSYLVIGTAWDKVYEDDIHNLIEVLSGDMKIYKDNYDVLIIAGPNLEYSRAISPVIAMLTEHISIKDTYFYGFREDKTINSLDEEVNIFAAPSEESSDAAEENDATATADLTKEINDDKAATEENADDTAVMMKSIDDIPGVDKNVDDTVEKSVDIKSDIQDEEANSRESVNLSEHLGSDRKDSILKTAYRMILNDRIYCATAYLYSMIDVCPGIEDEWKRLAYAINDPIKNCRYSTSKMFSRYPSNTGVLNDYLCVCGTLRTFFYNHVEYDYESEQLFLTLANTNKLLDECNSISSVLRTLYLFKNKIHKGINEYADYKMEEYLKNEKKLKDTITKAQIFYDKNVMSYLKDNPKFKRYAETRKLVHGKESDMARYLKVIINGDEDLYADVEEWLRENFIKDESEINSVNRDDQKIQYFIDEMYKRADEKLTFKKKTSDLMGVYRQKLQNIIEKAVDIMCDWYMYNKNNQANDDKSHEEYKKIKDELISDLVKTREYFSGKTGVCEEEAVGIKLLCTTIDELVRRLDGSYSDSEHKYFYIDFLKADRVLLDSRYLPITEANLSVPHELNVSERIIEHSETTLLSFEDRLKDIFMGEDDYGSAVLIKNYLDECPDNSDHDFADFDKILKDSVEVAYKDASEKKERFVENLELMQSYGQIDNTGENKKEQYIQIINATFDFCDEMQNYGFFKSVITAFEEKIKHDAVKLEETIRREVSAYKLESANEKDIDRREITEKWLEKIDDALDRQNYTVAEDLLSRLKSGDISFEYSTVLSRDYLQEYINTYQDIFEIVAKKNTTLYDLVKHRFTENQTNEDAKCRRILIENWPRNKKTVKENDLKLLLMKLGFKVDDVKKNLSFQKDRMLVYDVTLQKLENGRRANYNHPISVFGSYAYENGFRIAIIFGEVDPDGLMEAFKEIGNAKNTIVLLDYALQLADKRRLARILKVKGSHEKTFAVIDRVAIMYLIKKYNVSYINRMLMSIIIPFAYVQPYVKESATVMPPDIFMGRKRELSNIESATGANIVYGGRQLGKSALLRMAKNDIDKNENGDRAVLIDIKGLDDKQTVRKIFSELYISGILSEKIESDDWSLLGETLKKRLKDETDRIPYLLLLLDEADTFIDSCSKVNFAPMDVLKDIQGIGNERFKFVIAGLHNIVRFNRDVALSNNSSITHLEHITVKPFKFSEAKELLETPLYYLGFRFYNDDSEPDDNGDFLESLIFASANYFPGLIQLYCYKLIEAITRGDYAGYDECDSPIYRVSRKHIKKVLAEETFMQEVREKFEITLKLDEDNYYDIFALIIAYLYHEEGKRFDNGYSVDEIKNVGCEYNILKVVNIRDDKIEALLRELCELNVLRETNGRYLFNRYSFLQMMGSKDEIENRLMEYMED